jgi:tRNA(adenine34) deaminase
MDIQQINDKKPDSMLNDEYFMKQALVEANKALKANEVPIGAVVVSNNKIIARGHNLTETLGDPTAHAEMQAYTAATDFLGGKYLMDCTLYVTLEPCIMCAGASYWSQIGRIVYGASDAKQGYKKLGIEILHPKTIVVGGVLEDECANLLISFFKSKR